MATKKITELSNLATPVGADILPIVDDVAGTATTKKVTATNLMTLAPVQSVAGRTGTVTLSNTDISGLGTAATSASTDFSPAFFSIVSETTTARTLSNSDNGKVIVCSNAGQVIVTIPSGLTSGFNCTITQGGAGTVTIVGSGASINGFNNKTATAGQYAVVNIIPVGANAYYVDGDLITAPLINNYSLDLDGTNDHATIDPSGTTSCNSVSAWFKSDTTINASTLGGVLFSTENFNFNIAFGGNHTSDVTDEVILVKYGGSFAYTSSSASINTDWHHVFIAWVSSSSTNSGSAGYDIWLDGVKVGNASGGSVPSSPFSLNATSRFGGRADNTRFFGGLVDEVAIWTSDVSSDIATIYNSGVPNNLNDSSNVSTAPTHWWRMGDSDGGTGTTLTDVGSDGTIDLTLVNGPTFSTTVPS